MTNEGASDKACMSALISDAANGGDAHGPKREHAINSSARLNVCGADHVGLSSDGSIQARSLTPAQKKAFEGGVVFFGGRSGGGGRKSRGAEVGNLVPGEDRYPMSPI